MYSTAISAGAVLLEVGVDAVRVGRERVAGLGVEQRPLLLRDPAPAHRADVLVGLEAVLAEQLGEPAGRHVAADVHLEEPVLRGHEALRAHQVGVGVGVDLGDPVVVADHLDLRVESRELELAVGVGHRSAYERGDGERSSTISRARRGRDVGGPAQAARRLAEEGAQGEVVVGAGRRLLGHLIRHCAVRLAVDRVECQRVAGPPDRVPEALASKVSHAHLSVRLHRVRPRVRAVPELQRRLADRVPASARADCARCSTPWVWCSRARASTAPTAAPGSSSSVPAATSESSSLVLVLVGLEPASDVLDHARLDAEPQTVHRRLEQLTRSSPVEDHGRVVPLAT